jgi:hypothetical protein
MSANDPRRTINKLTKYWCIEVNIQIQRRFIIFIFVVLQSCANQGIYSSQNSNKNSEPNEYASDVVGVEIALPNEVEWVLVTERAHGNEYLKE